MLAGAARGEMGSNGGGGRVRLSDVDTWELAGFLNQLICRFTLVVDKVGGGMQEFVNNMNGPAFLERELVELNVDGYQ